MPDNDDNPAAKAPDRNARPSAVPDLAPPDPGPTARPAAHPGARPVENLPDGSRAGPHRPAQNDDPEEFLDPTSDA